MLLLNYAHIKIAVGQLLLDILEPDYTHLLCTDGSVIFVCSLPAARISLRQLRTELFVSVTALLRICIVP